MKEIYGRTYFKYDTIMCVSVTGNIFKGILCQFDGADMIKIYQYRTIIDFRYSHIRHSNIVLIEKIESKKITSWHCEGGVNLSEYKFVAKFD